MIYGKMGWLAWHGYGGWTQRQQTVMLMISWIRRGHRGDDDGDCANGMNTLSPSQVSLLPLPSPPSLSFVLAFVLFPLLVHLRSALFPFSFVLISPGETF